jgi:hypothetical protein
MFSFLYYAVPHSNCYTLLLENISSYFVMQQLFSLSYVPYFLFVLLHSMPYSIRTFLNVTVHHYNVFTKAVFDNYYFTRQDTKHRNK